MNFLGDYVTKYMGVGGETNPSMCYGAETNTGTYLDTPGPSSAYTITKRGHKRIRVDDTKTTIYGPVNIPAGTSSAFSLPDGSASAPALNFTSHPAVGFWFDGSVASSPTLVTEAAIQRIDGGLVVTGTVATGSSMLVGSQLSANSLNILGTASITGSTTTGALNSSSVTSTGKILGPSGTNASPGVCVGATDSGLSSFISGTSSQLQFNIAGSNVAYIRQGGSLFSTGNIQVLDGFATQPSYSFSSGTSSGMYRSGSSVLISAGGSSVMAFASTGSSLSTSLTTGSQPVTCGALTSTSITNSGTASVSGAMTTGALTTTGNIATGTNSISTSNISSSAASINGGAYWRKNVTQLPSSYTLAGVSDSASIILLTSNPSPQTLTLPTMSGAVVGFWCEVIVTGALASAWTISAPVNVNTIYCKPMVSAGGAAGTNGVTRTNIIIGTTSSVGDRFYIQLAFGTWWVTAYLTAGTSVTYS